MKKYICILILILTALNSFAATEDLDEMVTRITRHGTAVWGPNYLEDSSNNYTWQPETLQYNDVTTGREVWFVTQSPNEENIYGKEHGINAWNNDGSSLGLMTNGRDTNDPAIVTTYRSRWIVNTDGSSLRVAHGYGRRSIDWEFNWSRVENSYYTIGSGGGDQTASTGAQVYKNTVGANNLVTGALVFDTTPMTTYSKNFAKEGVSQDGTLITLRDATEHANGDPNPIDTVETFFIDLTAEPVTATSWGIGRMIGPAGDPYGSHENADEGDWHDFWSPGPSPSWIMGDYGGGISDIFVIMKLSGSYTDNGPLWEDWDGDSFGVNEEIKVVSDGTGGGSPDNPYGMVYFGHPAFDRWGKYMMLGDTDSSQANAGTRIWDSTTNSLLTNYMMKGDYDGQHHSWTGWSDDVAMCDPSSLKIYGNTYTGTEASRYELADPHFPGLSGNYSGYPRPSQSPDGTKVAFSSCFLNDSGDDYPQIAYVVAYYPYAPEITATSATGGTATIRFDWQNTLADANPRTYTARGWPNETTDDRPIPRETNKYRLWRSADKVTWAPISTIDANHFTRFDFANGGFIGGQDSFWEIEDTPGDGTFYYAVTSIEHSGLESRTLSNIFSITVSGGSGTGSQDVVYPVDPGGDADITGNTYVGALDKGVHVYASDIESPAGIQQRRIASIVGSPESWVDWLGNQTGTSQYTAYRFDTMGNQEATPTPITVGAMVVPGQYPITFGIAPPTTGAIIKGAIIKGTVIK